MPKAKSAAPKKYYETDHGPEIFPRRLILTPEEHQWRKEAEAFLREREHHNPPAFLPAVGVLREQQAIYQVHSAPSKKEKYEAERERNRDLSRILLTLRVVNEILKVQYGSPDWGNQPHIIGELVYILLTRRSKIR